MLGQLGRDLVLRVGEPPGTGQAAPVRSRREMLGGKGGNQAVGLAQLGMPTALVGVLGADDVGDGLLERLGADHVDASHVVRRPGAETALIVDVVDDHGQWRYLEHIPDAVLATEGDVFAASSLIGAARAVVVQLQQPASSALTTARLARAAGASVVLDGAPAADGHRELLALAEVVRADAREAEYLAGHPINGVQDAHRAARDLLAAGPELVVLAVSGQGNLFATREGYEFLPLLDTPVVDTTGAGDALVATLTAARTRGRPYREAARLAVSAAAETASHAGGRPELTPEDLRTPR